MVDVFDRDKRRAIMQSVRRAGTSGVGTKPEIVVATWLGKLGFTLEREPSEVVGRPDIFFPDAKLAVFVHGCFWHGHTACHKGRQKTKSNVSFWEEKIRKNHQRDARIARRLRSAGVHVYIVWECQIRRGVPPSRVANAVRRAHGHRS